MLVSCPWNTQKWEYSGCLKKRQQHKEWASQVTGLILFCGERIMFFCKGSNSTVVWFGFLMPSFEAVEVGHTPAKPCPRFLGWLQEGHWSVFLFPSSQHPRLGGTSGDLLSGLQLNATLNLTAIARGFFLFCVENLWEQRSTAFSSA